MGRILIKEIFSLGRCPVTLPFRGFRQTTPLKFFLTSNFDHRTEIIEKFKEGTGRSVSQNQEVFHRTIKEFRSKCGLP